METDTAGCDGRVLLTARDLGAVDNLVHYGMAADHPVRPVLLDKLDRAIVCAAPPPDLVTVDSRVLFRIGPEGEDDAAMGGEMRVLVLPGRYVPNGLCLSLISPLGAALLGLRGGHRAEYRDFGGRRLEVTVAEVLYQPPARRKPPA